jgi:hypothetical protein
MSSRPAAAWRKVSPPRHRRDREWRSLARTNPAGRGKPACVYENVRFATTVLPEAVAFGARYRITNGTTMNVIELDKTGVA